MHVVVMYNHVIIFRVKKINACSHRVFSPQSMHCHINFDLQSVISDRSEL